MAKPGPIGLIDTSSWRITQDLPAASTPVISSRIAVSVPARRAKTHPHIDNPRNAASMGEAV